MPPSNKDAASNLDDDLSHTQALDGYWNLLVSGPVVNSNEFQRHPGSERMIGQLEVLELLSRSSNEIRNASSQTNQLRETDASNAAPRVALPPQLHPGEQLGGKLRILSLLGRGGMGEVYAAWHETLEREVAVKVLPAEHSDSSSAVSRFRKSIAAQAKPGTHPNIAALMDAGEHKGKLYLVMEYVVGVDLAKLVHEQHPIPWPNVCNWMRQAAQGLEHAHQAGLVHRDIKPANLMLTRDGTIKLLDWGLASTAGGLSNGDASLNTEPNTALGTFDFMAPEQAVDAASADARSDLYSLGCTMYQLLAGHPPFSKHKSQISKVVAHNTETAPLIRAGRPDVPVRVEQLVARLMAKDPDQRFATAVAVEHELSNLLLSPPSPPSRWWKLAGAAAAALVLAAVVFVQTDKGTLKIDFNSQDVEVVVSQAGHQVAIVDLKTGSEVRLRSGNYELALKGNRNHVTIKPTRTRLGRGNQVIAEIIPVTNARRASIAEPNRRAAEWAIRHQAQVEIEIDGQLNLINGIDSLPAEGREFAVTLIGIPGNDIGDSDLEVLRNLPRLRNLFMEGSHITGRGMEILGQLNSLVSLQLAWTPSINDEGVAHLQNLKQLELLDLTQSSITSKGVETIVGLPKLRILKIDEVPATGAEVFPLLAKATQLRLFAMSGSAVSDDDLQLLSQVECLESLSLSGTVTGLGFRHLKGLTSLRMIGLPRASVTPEGMATLKDLPSFQEAAFYHASLGDAELEQLCQARNLRVLNLEGTRVTDAGIKSLSQLPLLRWLGLVNTNITDEGMKALESLNSLESLVVVGTKITDKGLISLRKLKSLKNLNAHTTFITESGVKSFKLACPQCEIIWQP